MEITPKVLSIPPYIATSWDQISLLRSVEGVLHVVTTDNVVTQIPHLADDQITRIFAMYEKHMQESASPIELLLATLQTLGAIGTVGISLEHNEDHASLPTLPSDIIDKVRSMIDPEELALMPDPIPSCQCMYCQVKRSHPDLIDEPVAEHELQFSEWDVVSLGPQLFQVTHKLAPEESYKVFLGDPMGCTCGQRHCPHLLAVLKS